MTDEAGMIFDDAERLLGVLAIQLLTTDDSPDIAFGLVVNRSLADLGWERSARAWELIAVICMSLVAGKGLGELLQPPNGMQSIEHGMADQVVVFFAVRDLVLAGSSSVALGKVVDEYTSAYESDPAGLSWAMFQVASGAVSSLSIVTARELSMFDDVGAGDLARQGPSRMSLDWVAGSIAALRDQPGQ